MLSRRSWSLALLVAGAVSFSTFVACGPAKSKCTAATCFGCCDADGECQGGASQLACGSGGAACQACAFGSLCQLGFCAGGTGGGSGSGGGGGSSGGGGGSTGGGGGSTGGGGGSTGGGGGSTGGGGGSTGGGGGSTGGGGGSTGGGGGSVGGGGGSTGGGGGGSTGGGGGSLAGDTCATAETVTFVNNVASVTGTTSGYANNISASCANAGQPDRFYVFSLTQTTEMEFILVSSGFWPALSVHPYLGGSCGSELGCIPAAGTGVTLTQLVTVPTGTWAVVIDGVGTNGGSFTLTARKNTPLPTVDAGTVNPLSNGVAVSISGIDGSEQVFTINVPTGTASLTVSTSGGTSGDVDLFLRRGAPPDLVNSTYDVSAAATGNSETLSVQSPAAGLWYLTAFGYAPYAGVTLIATW